MFFHCRHGKAYLFNKVFVIYEEPPLYDRANVSVTAGDAEEMMTGLHIVADIFCVGCGSIVGWKYEFAHAQSQKYKEGKSVLEWFKITGPDGSSYWALHEAHIMEANQMMFKYY